MGHYGRRHGSEEPSRLSASPSQQIRYLYPGLISQDEAGKRTRMEKCAMTGVEAMDNMAMQIVSERTPDVS